MASKCSHSSVIPVGERQVINGTTAKKFEMHILEDCVFKTVILITTEIMGSG